MTNDRSVSGPERFRHHPHTTQTMDTTTRGHEMTAIADVLAEHQQKVGIRDMRSHCWCGWAGEGTGRAFIDHQANSILAAGYRRPRQVTTVEELDALPAATVVKDALTQVFEKQEAGIWHDGPHDWLAFDGKFWDVDAIHLPATVLHVGGAL